MDNRFFHQTNILPVVCFIAILMFASTLLAGKTTLSISWSSNSESDLSGYYVHIGKTSGTYDLNFYTGKNTSYEIEDVETGNIYYIAIRAADYAGNKSAYSDEASVRVPEIIKPPVEEDESKKARLGDKAYVFPNPFQPSEEQLFIRYEILESAQVSIDILDLGLNPVETIIDSQLRQKGIHRDDSWDGRSARGKLVANGVYYCRIRTGADQEIIKVALKK